MSRARPALGPMVRGSTLPLRLLALRYGAGRLYTDEIVDRGLLRARRLHNEQLQTVDFIQKGGRLIFRTCSEEKPNLVLQLGTSDPERAVDAARLVKDHVSGVDVNMGCPKDFSINYGMGAALMSDPPKAREILSALVESLNIPITCKIRIYPSAEKTLEFVNYLIPSGISAIAVHGRTKDEKPNDADHPDIIKYISERISIPVIANGASKRIKQYEDIAKFSEETGCGTVMLSRAALWNCSIFRPEGLLPLDDVITEYLKLAIQYDYEIHCKYILMRAMGSLLATDPRGIRLVKCKTFEEICDIWNVGDIYRETKSRRPADYYENVYTVPDIQSETLYESDDEEDLIELEVAFSVPKFQDQLPKSRLAAWMRQNELGTPQYKIKRNGPNFKAILKINGEKYASSLWQKNKLYAEQASAIVCLRYLHLL